jgi:hypothetical protein
MDPIDAPIGGPLAREFVFITANEEGSSSCAIGRLDFDQTIHTIKGEGINVVSSTVALLL